MSTKIDPLGNWSLLAEYNFVDTEWHFLPSPSIGGEIFRITYFYDLERWANWEGFRSWVFVRSVWLAGAVLGNLTKQVSTSARLWPKQETEIREFVIPEQFKEEGLVARNFEVKLRPYGTSKWPYQSAIPLKIKIEEKL